MKASDMQAALSVVIPLFNESVCLKENINKTLAFIDGLDTIYELVLVDDGSTDTTLELCRGLAESHPQIRVLSYSPNRGKGFAVKTGMLAASGRFILFMDADLAVPLEYLPQCLKRLEQGAPVVIASRHAPGAVIQVSESKLREFMGEVFRKMAQTGLGLPVSDITCGLKGFSQEAARAIFPLARVERWTYDAEILLIAKKLGYVVAEVPITWFHSDHSAVRVGRDAAQSIIDMLKIFYWSHANSYKIHTSKPKESG